VSDRVDEPVPRVGPVSWWERLWFTPTSPAALLAVRVLVFTTVAADVWRQRLHLETLPERASRIWDPISVIGTLGVPPPTPAVVGALTWLTLLGCALALVPRSAVARAGAVLTLATYGTLLLAENSFGKIDHAHQPLLVALVVLALASSPRRGDSSSWRWGWPVQACRAGLAVMLLAAAWSKVAGGGLEWVLGPNLRNIIVVETLLLRDPPLGDLGLWVAAEPWRWQLAALGTVVGEAVLVAALVVRRQPWRGLLVVAGVGTLVGITLLLDLVGFPLVVLAAVFLDVDALGEARRDPRRRWLAGGAATAGLTVLAVTTWLATGRLLPVVPLAAFAAVVGWLTAPRGPGAPSERPAAQTPTVVR
jgi:hypothetical protein